jgi:hypothetical protein
MSFGHLSKILSSQQAFRFKGRVVTNLVDRLRSQNIVHSDFLSCRVLGIFASVLKDPLENLLSAHWTPAQESGSNLLKFTNQCHEQF